MSESNNKRPVQQNAFFAWQESKPGLVIVAVLDYFIAYLFVSLAIATGSLLQWFIAIVFLVLAVVATVKFVKKAAKRG